MRPGQNADCEALRGKVVLVTGSSCGLGAELVRLAASRRARVVVNCRENRRGAEALAEEVQRSGGEALACRADVTDYEEARDLVSETVRAFGRVDVLVNTVGQFEWKPVSEMEPREWRSLMASNLDSVYNMCRSVLPSMRRNRWGRIVNFGAVGAEHTTVVPKLAAYTAAKAAVVAFSKALALEEARCGITVNVVAPGVMVGDGAPPRDGDEPCGHLADRVPVGRPGSPEDVARAVFFFTAPEADFVTGQVLAVSGGWGL